MPTVSNVFFGADSRVPRDKAERKALSDVNSLRVVNSDDDAIHTQSPSSLAGTTLAIGLPLTNASMREASMPIGILAKR
ncbi:hypothetical protein [Selenomonas sp. WCT3]|uniref:hypothetical protein n=1 Tax=Selenomonas sp. WCT3 TaxID=3158785 RepID=UPI00117ABC62